MCVCMCVGEYIASGDLDTVSVNILRVDQHTLGIYDSHPLPQPEPNTPIPPNTHAEGSAVREDEHNTQAYVFSRSTHATHVTDKAVDEASRNVLPEPPRYDHTYESSRMAGPRSRASRVRETDSHMSRDQIVGAADHVLTSETVSSHRNPTRERERDLSRDEVSHVNVYSHDDYIPGGPYETLTSSSIPRAPRTARDNSRDQHEEDEHRKELINTVSRGGRRRSSHGHVMSETPSEKGIKYTDPQQVNHFPREEFDSEDYYY